MAERAQTSVTAVPALPQPPVPWGIWTGIGVLIVSFMVEIIGVVILRVAAGLLGLTDAISKHTVEFSLLAYQFLGLGVALCAFYLLTRYRIDLDTLGFRPPGWRTLLSVAGLIPFVLVAVALISFLFDTFLPGYHLHGNAHELLGNSGQHLSLPWKIAIAIWAAVEAPMVEETLFRGIMYSGFRTFFTRWVPGPLAIFSAALCSGLIFGAVHFEPHTLPILAFLGIVLAYVFQATRSLYGSALVHGAINALAVIQVLSS